MRSPAEIAVMSLVVSLALGLFGGIVGTTFYLFLRNPQIPKDKKIKEILKIYGTFVVLIFISAFLLLHFLG